MDSLSVFTFFLSVG